MLKNLLILNRRGFVGFVGAAATAISCSCGKAVAQQPAAQGSPINMYLNGFHF